MKPFIGISVFLSAFMCFGPTAFPGIRVKIPSYGSFFELMKIHKRAAELLTDYHRDKRDAILQKSKLLPADRQEIASLATLIDQIAILLGQKERQVRKNVEKLISSPIPPLRERQDKRREHTKILVGLTSFFKDHGNSDGSPEDTDDAIKTFTEAFLKNPEQANDIETLQSIVDSSENLVFLFHYLKPTMDLAQLKTLIQPSLLLMFQKSACELLFLTARAPSSTADAGSRLIGAGSPLVQEINITEIEDGEERDGPLSQQVPNLTVLPKQRM